MSAKIKKRYYRDYKEDLLERLESPTYAKVFLGVALEEYQKDGDAEAFLLALRDVAQAQGGIGQLAEKTQLNRQNLYKVFSEKGNPRFKTVEAILRQLGFRFSIERTETV